MRFRRSKILALMAVAFYGTGAAKMLHERVAHSPARHCQECCRCKGAFRSDHYRPAGQTASNQDRSAQNGPDPVGSTPDPPSHHHHDHKNCPVCFMLATILALAEAEPPICCFLLNVLERLGEFDSSALTVEHLYSFEARGPPHLNSSVLKLHNG